MISLRHNEPNTSLGLRVSLHHYAQSLFKKSPLLGTGTGGFKFLYSKDQPLSFAPNVTEPHGQYWLILAEGGIIGIMLYFFFLSTLYGTTLKLKESKSILIGILIVFCILSLSDTIFCYSTLGYLLIIFSALCFGELLEKKVNAVPYKKRRLWVSFR